MNKKLLLWICCLLITAMSATMASASAQTRYPVTVSSFHVKKTSPFISDYLSNPTNYINVLLTFNDLQEPNLEVFFKLSIESSSVKLTTSSTFRPNPSTILYPGENTKLTDEELLPYLQPQNMSCSGITQEELLRNGILPEGIYTFSLRVFELHSGKEVAREVKQTAWIKQFEPPVLTLPMQAGLLSDRASEIFFSWNQAMLGELQQFLPEYTLFLYEVPDFEAHPEQAVNGSGRLIFTSEPLSGFSFLYSSVTEIPLTLGKRYAWRVQVKTADGREVVKNGGFSSVGWFYYGYPSNGNIILKYPADNAALQRTDVPVFSWKACDNIIDNMQAVEYRLYVMRLSDEEVAMDFLEDGEMQEGMQIYSLGPYFNKKDVEYILKSELKSGNKYAWQVKAFTDEQQIGKSEVRFFSAPPLLESFICGGGGGHTVKVTSLDNDDLKDLSGRGRIKINKETDEEVEVAFEHISLANAGFYYLEKGEIKTALSGVGQVMLAAHVAVNNNIIFRPDSLLITPQSLHIKGNFRWKFPLDYRSVNCRVENDSLVVVSEWLNYDELQILGTNALPLRMSVTLDNGFVMAFDGSSYFSFENNIWRMNFNGSIKGHRSVRTKNDSVYTVFFENWEQLELNTVEGSGRNGFDGGSDDGAYNFIRPIKNINLFILPQETVIDFSESPQQGSEGIYFKEFNIVMKKELDMFGQVALSEEYVEEVRIGNNSLAHIDGDGLRFLYSASVGGSLSDTLIKFNTFPSPLDLFNIDIEQSAVSEAMLKGHIKIPLISTTRDFPFSIPLSDEGFQTGYLDDELAGLNFVLNPNDKAQKIEGNIKRAFFDGQDHLSLDISLKWEHIGLDCGHIPRFFIYGNTDIGFGGNGGVASLIQQQQGNIDGYDVNFQGIGAGRMCYNYAFAVTGAIVLDENIAGKNGPAITNAYSIEENPLLPRDCAMEEQNIETKKLAPAEGNFTMSDEGYGMPENDNNDYAAQQELIERQTAMYSDALAGMGDAINELLANDISGTGGALFDWQGFSSGVGDTSSFADLAELSLQDIVDVLRTISPLLDTAIAEKINRYVDVLQAIEPSADEVNKWIGMFKDGTFAKFIAEGIAAKVVSYVEEPLAKEADKLKTLMHDKTMFAVDTVMDMLISLVDKASNAVFKSALAAQELSDNPEKLKDKLQIILKETVDDVMLEVKRSIDSSVEENLIPYFTNFIDTLVHARIADFLEEQIAKTVHKLFTKQMKSITIKEFSDDAKEHFKQIGNDFVNLFKWNNLGAMLKKTGKDIIDGYDWMKLLGNLSTELVGLAAQELLGDKIDEINAKIEGTGLGGITDALADNVKIDFTKLKGGDIKNAIKFDPTFIKIQSPVADAEGYAKRVKDDPIYGDVFRAGLNVQVKVPKPFNVWATFMSGKTAVAAGGSDVTVSDDVISDANSDASLNAGNSSTFNYWFIELSCRKLGLPMSPVPLSFDGAAGRVFCRMKRDGNTMASAYVPDYNTKFGAGMSAWFFDTPGSGAIAVFGVDFSLDVFENKKFKMTMLGDADISNTIDASGNVKKSLINGKIDAGYSNVDNIFYANAKVDLNTSPLLCAGGEFRARITPDEWSLSVGTRQNPVFAKLLCMDFAKVEAWTEVTNRYFDVGVHALLDASFKSPWLGKEGFRVRATSTLYFEMLADAVVYWKPLKLKDANFWLESEFEVGVDYDILGDQGHFTIAGIAFGGGMSYLSRTREEMIAWQGAEDCPSTYTAGSYSCIRGWLHGRLTVLGVGFGVKVYGQKEWHG
ncbi:MAG: hypothetical protein LBR45_01895 [Bacteroidales bacterium]|jgi:F0F1-type ATP synthase delta subunit|nr:hypothetical protein [Bacteroidales bacterium]